MKKYKRPGNHALFLDRALEEHLIEFFEDLYVEEDSLLEALKSNPADAAHLRQDLARVQRVLGTETSDRDLLADFWDAEVAAGREPDLDMTETEVKAILAARKRGASVD